MKCKKVSPCKLSEDWMLCPREPLTPIFITLVLFGISPVYAAQNFIQGS